VLDAPIAPRKSRAPLLAIVASVAVTGAGGAWLALGSPDVVEGPKPAVGLPLPEAAVERGKIDPQAQVVRVAISTIPDGAKLLLDGSPIANPFQAELPKTKSPRLLEAQLEGYRAVRQELVMLYPQTVRLTMEPMAAPAKAPADPPAADRARAKGKTSRESAEPNEPKGGATATPDSEPARPATPAPSPRAAPAPAPQPRVATQPEPAATPASTSRKLKQPF
jgi:hypothetical protein